jgi:acyl-CoA synthetase (AMP-forming)/AMP-acid ligase II
MTRHDTNSGTTGLPKGVCLTHFNLISNFLQMADIDPPDDDGTPSVCGVCGVCVVCGVCGVRQ